ncbi:methylmalonyl Co-A mutase-associated GTPase MeaB [Aeoliella sp. ICT_H6.2]|uniref:Methylmalonyl Co-A mutase-associated GTPase MeaB n=1 Tax=Aeoliella straminimaris TaxID=2954799 RepID=A0A9X2F7S3_9BACT|nr:methylmalonyl Co-A mutase-associated GTPase MeaB [Aeoliella straminimaris]MCO6043248.1 methylmalonyl Co-A mutase-associated GTPase MeaB [Aeoliella straminimaris]
MGSSSRRRALTLEDYYAGVVARNIAVLPRALTLVESTRPEHQLLAEQLMTRILPHTGQSIRVGITGPPGVGKSTFIEALGMYLVGLGRKVAVLAVDPSSGVSGGSILGDKTRMAHLSAEPNAFIRPSPSAGTLGGVARKTRETMLICEAAGFEIVLIETVGVGQSETMVAEMTDCFLALMMPGGGDELQGIKRGLLELVDVIAVNKADGVNRQPAEVAARQLERILHALTSQTDEPPAVLTCSALEHTSIDAVWNAIERRQEKAQQLGLLAERRCRQSARWMWSIVDEQLRHAVHSSTAVAKIRNDLESKVLEGVLAPEAAARSILEACGLKVGET